MASRKIEIMDTTLRDGEQTSGVSFSASEKLTIAKLLLEELKVDRIEIASARVSEGEFQAVKSITSWASNNGYIDAVEVLTDTVLDLLKNAPQKGKLAENIKKMAKPNATIDIVNACENLLNKYAK